ncbi:(2Fe-2S)-binding protein (plasmid) [Mycobacterium paragordonae]|uniref:Vanillate monooxygenase n=1 Tax=Mycobacterium paragordonae TaxID=1389713 RepID=A0ABQ1CEP5_9MYCO|nr:Rieske 2Fe-2S domain-containing protein [Mycobacterium paragordonae]AYE99350.1 (2Fe-2S)-binding protein [Mycobacterium paragordonae]RUP02739.1 MAG: aromatic ring-hydroxylating dioxygenase subunit alpha [Mycobacterium sp.]GFG82890.1 vanillate monooxygenase [Mycobacterium paragordonae]
MKANYPKKCWYVAATCDEVTDSPLGRRLLGEDVVLWRGAGGRVTAFENRCAHRAFPLSHSSVHGDRLVCGYHGCTYDTDGKCVYIPSQPQVPTRMSVPVFPILEKPPFIWIWLGPPAAAAASQPPSLPWINDPAWATFASAWQVSANYMMVHEHYLDFSYAPVIHAKDLPPGLASMPAFNSVEVTETTVSYTRIMSDLPLTDWHVNATGLDRNLLYRHSESGTFVSPAIHRQYWNIETSNGEAYTTTRTHGITPETESSTHVFMQSSRNYRTDSDDVTAGLRSFLDGVAQRDVPILEMASLHSGYDGWRGGVEFQADAAALRARRIVGVMLAKEAGRAAIRPGLASASRGGSRSPRKPITSGD